MMEEYPKDSTADMFVDELIKRERIKYVFSTVGIAFTLFALTRLVSKLILTYVILLFFRELATAWWMDWLMPVVPMYCFALPVLMLMLSKISKSPHNGEYTVKGKQGEADEVRTKPRFGIKNLLFFFVTSMGLMYIGSYIGDFVMTVISTVVGYDYSNMLGSMTDATPLWFTVIVICIVAPVGEEFIFRKLLIDRIRRFGDVTAILVSAFLFGAIHMNFYQFFYALFVGVIISYVYTLTGKLRYCIALHALVNFVGTIAVPTLTSFVDHDVIASGDANAIATSVSASPFGYILYFTVAFLIQVMMLLSVILIAVYCSKRLALSQSSVKLRTGNIATAVIGNSGMITAIVIISLLYVISLTPY
jgi:membrane protease YdiL (CAAX protease family)